MQDGALDRLLTVKTKLLETKERDLATAVLALDHAVQTLTGLEQQISEYYRDTLSSLMDGRDFCVFKDYMAYLEAEKARSIVARRQAEAKVDVIKSELVELLKEVKSLEKLRDRRLIAIRHEENRRAQKQLDAMSLRAKSTKRLIP
jgi:flagellar export protein FliJ